MNNDNTTQNTYSADEDVMVKAMLLMKNDVKYKIMMNSYLLALHQNYKMEKRGKKFPTIEEWIKRNVG
jgi:hypothetical protein